MTLEGTELGRIGYTPEGRPTVVGIAAATQLLAFWMDGGALECWEYDASGFYVSTLATVSIGFTPTGFFGTDGENLAWRSCFVGTGAPANALLVMADEVADVIKCWDIANGTLVSSAYTVLASPLLVGAPLLCGNVGDGNGYVMHEEVDGVGNRFVYVHCVDRNGVTLIATIGPAGAGDLEQHGFTRGGQSAADIGDAAMIYDNSASEMHEVALPGGSVNVRTSFGRIGTIDASVCVARDSGFATCGVFYAEGSPPHSTAMRLANGGYNTGKTFISHGFAASGAAIPPDAAETNQISVNQAHTSLSQYEFDRTATPTGRLKHMKWKSPADASLSNVAPSLVISAKDHPTATAANMPHFIQIFALDPFP